MHGLKFKERPFSLIKKKKLVYVFLHFSLDDWDIKREEFFFYDQILMGREGIIQGQGVSKIKIGKW